MRSLAVLLVACLVLWQPGTGQELKSGKVKYRLNNMPVVEPAKPDDTEGPVLEIIAPATRIGDVYQTDDREIDLIGQVTDASAVNFVSVNSKIGELNDKNLFTFPLTLEPGPNEISLAAMDGKRNMTERNIVIQYTPPVITLADRIKETSTYYALLIGIEKYRDPDLPDLDNPIRDAEELQEVLLTAYTFEAENIRFLKNAERGDIIRSMDELAQEITPDDNLLIFYAGHGWWDQDADNGYWLPSDAERGVKTNWVRNSTIVDYLKEIDSKHTLLIADACFGGSIFKTRSAFPTREKAFEILYDLPSRKAMTSGTLTEVPDRSAFTGYLIERLKENDQTYLSSEQLFSSFRIAVINNSDAIPQYGEINKVGDEGGDFIFVRNQ